MLAWLAGGVTMTEILGTGLLLVAFLTLELMLDQGTSQLKACRRCWWAPPKKYKTKDRHRASHSDDSW
jgi:hypothetical protein